MSDIDINGTVTGMTLNAYRWREFNPSWEDRITIIIDDEGEDVAIAITREDADRLGKWLLGDVNRQ